MNAGAGTLTEQLIADHLVEGSTTPGSDVGIQIDQVLLQDVLGPLVWIEFEALGFPTVENDVVVTYADHQVYEFDERDTSTHRYLRTVTQRHGGYYSKPGNGICHQVHRERFTSPGATIIGSDSHTPTAGGFGALGLGAGGLDVAVAMGGEPYLFPMPEIVNVRLEGSLPAWASAKDLVLELLRRLSVQGGVGTAFEFTGPGVDTLSVPERCTVANMTTELGATTGVFPSDEQTRGHLARLGREDDYQPLAPEPDATYADRLTVDLDTIEPLVATPGMPDNVMPVREVAGTPVDQILVGSCTNGSYAEIATVANILTNQQIAPTTDMIIAPASKRAVELLAREGQTADLYAAGVNLSEATCGACCGQGHIPADDSISLRTFNRNYRGRSGNEDDAVYLCSPEIAAASAIAGELVDPRDTDLPPPHIEYPDDMTSSNADIVPPDPDVEIHRGDTIGRVPLGDALPSSLAGPVLLRMGDDITTDHILPATAESMSTWPDPEVAADFTLTRIDEKFADRARESPGGWLVAGENYGQGSSRENAALELSVLGVDGVLAKSFARIHLANLYNFGLFALTFTDPGVHDDIQEGDHLTVQDDVVAGVTAAQEEFSIRVNDDWAFTAALAATDRQRDVLAAGGKLNYVRRRHGND